MDPVSERLRARHPQKIDLSLDRMRTLCAVLGEPQHRLPPVIHVAGTNGKGSTIAFIRAMAEAAGLKVHVYTSPHLVRFNERIRLAGELISDEPLSAILDRIEAAGIEHVVVNVHYLADALEAHLAAQTRPFTIAVSDERKPRPTPPPSATSSASITSAPADSAAIGTR